MRDETHATLEDALIHEVWRQDLSAVQRLLEAGANPNLPGRGWSSAIACAGENDETGDIVRALVASGADINLQDSNGYTPLYHAVDIAIDGACQQNRETIDWSVVAVLIDLGANPDLPDNRGKTVRDLAMAYSAQSSFEEFLRSRE
ncbi:ankyrin repeat domain-containing protein [Gimesia panareensis]|uniref:ankyrin repeat domain-containing protein n=1 Tax=Gimesia panareensis TaxID=2527978 RepID=UPI0011A4D1A2|nr:ankyrin repeat domain-containing protein [Gimesia panareensis]